MKEAALVTGASRGIGLELTRCLVKDGKNCVIVARSKDKLRRIKNDFESRYGPSLKVISEDLSRPSAPDDIIETLRESNIKIHTLINNAGFGNYGRFVDNSWSRELDLIQLNIVSLTYLTRLLVEPMVERGYGRVMNVASTASFVPGPYMSTYYASKAYVLSFSEGLAEELKSEGVTVTALCPGFTETDFQEEAGIADSGLVDRIPVVATPESVAKYGYKAMNRGKVVAVHGFLNKLAVFFLRFLPGFLIRRVLGYFQGGRLRSEVDPAGGESS